jgi:WD40 repeat protein
METRGHRGAIRAVAFHPKEKLLASAGLDGSIRLWNTDTGKLLRILVGHAGPVNALAWSSSTGRLASASDDRTVRLWDPASGQGEILRGAEGPVSAVGWIDGGNSVAARTGVDTVAIWEVATGKRRRQLRGLGLDAASILAWSPDGKLLATSHTAKKMVKVWKAATGGPRHSFQDPAWLNPRSESHFLALDWSGDSRMVASCTLWFAILKGRSTGPLLVGMRVQVNRWDAAKGTQLTPSLVFPMPYPPKVDGPRITGERVQMRKRLGFFTNGLDFQVALEPQGKHLVFSALEGMVFADTTTHQTQILPNQTSPHLLSGLAFAPDGKTFATGYLSGELCLWDSAKRQVRLKVPGCSPVAATPAIAWSPRGRRLAVCPWEGVLIWDVKEGIYRLCGRGGDPLAWSPDGKTLAASSANNGPVLWKTASGEQIPTRWAAVQLRRQRARFPQFVSLNRSARSWAGVQLRREKRPGKGKKGKVNRVQFLPVQALAWSAGGRRLAWSSGGGNAENAPLMINRVPSGEQLAKSKGKVSGVTALAWSPTGLLLASNGVLATKPNAANAVLLWEVQKGALEPHLLEVHRKPVTAVAWSPKGAILASGSQDQWVNLWKDGKLWGTLKAKQGAIVALRWLSERRLVSLATDGTVCYWDVPKKKLERSLKVAAGSGALSPDGRTLAGLSGQAVRLWELAKGQPLATLLFLRPDKLPRCLAVSPSGHYRGPKGVENDLVYVVQTAAGQEMLTPQQFAQKYCWKNDPKHVRLTEK